MPGVYKMACANYDNQNLLYCIFHDTACCDGSISGDAYLAGSGTAIGAGHIGMAHEKVPMGTTPAFDRICSRKHCGKISFD